MNDEREGLPSASSAERFVNCAASERLQTLAPKEESEDPLATEGSIIHGALEREDGSELTLTQAEIFEKLNEIDAELYQQWRLDYPIQDKGSEIREERFWLYDLEWKEKLASAKPDHVYIVGDHALVIDFKSGYKEVRNASSNWQGRVQAIAVKSNNPEITHIRIAFAQFRLRRYFTSCDYSEQDLIWAHHEFSLAKWRAQQPDAPATPGPWCSGCRAQGFCKAAGAIALLPSSMVNQGKKIDSKFIPMAVSELSIEDLKAIYDRRTIIENVLDAVKRRLKNLPDETLKALGYEKRPGAVYTTKIEINPLFQLLWDEGIWNHLPEESRQEEAIKEFSTVTTALTGKLEDLTLPRLIASGRFKLTKDAKSHLKTLLDKVSTKDTKEPTLRKLKGEE